MKKIYTLFFSILAFVFASDAQNIIPTSNELVLPQYAYYGGTNAESRIPFVCRLTLTGLLPSTTYRYFVGMSNNATLTSGAGNQAPGNMYRINNVLSLGGFGHITGFAANKAINSTEINNDDMQTTFTSQASRHGRFTTDVSGNYTGWFATVLIGNVAQPIGGDAYFYVQMNDGSGTAFTQSYRTTSTVRLLDFTATPGDPTGGTALLGTSDVGDEKMVALYDNVGGTGRPLYCTFTENNNTGGILNEGTIWTNPVLYPTVDGIGGSWAAIIPNTLTGGVKAINFINIPDGSIMPLSNAPATNTSNDGNWNGVSTANPVGGSSSPVRINSIAGSTLPVNLLSFRGEAAKEGVRLHWETTQEINNRYFEINRAGADGIFKRIGRVDAATNPALTNRYQFVDPHPIAGMNYYQLKQVDIDGRFATFKTIAIRFGVPANVMRLTYAGSSEIEVSLFMSEGKRGNIVYTDMVGNVLYNQPAILREGENIIRIPVAAQRAKMAVVSFVANNERINLKVLR